MGFGLWWANAVAVLLISKENITDLLEKTEEAKKKAQALNRQIFDITVTPKKEIPKEHTEALNKSNDQSCTDRASRWWRTRRRPLPV